MTENSKMKVTLLLVPTHTLGNSTVSNRWDLGDSILIQAVSKRANMGPRELFFIPKRRGMWFMCQCGNALPCMKRGSET